MLSVIDWSIDRREDDCIVRRRRRLGNVRHQFLFSSGLVKKAVLARVRWLDRLLELAE